MAPSAGGPASGEIAALIERDFGSFDKLKEEFSNAATVRSVHTNIHIIPQECSAILRVLADCVWQRMGLDRLGYARRCTEAEGGGNRQPGQPCI
jgi:hypothetical protein